MFVGHGSELSLCDCLPNWRRDQYRPRLLQHYSRALRNCTLDT